MSNFDLNKSIAVYISIVCRNIHSRKKRKAVAREYAEHIEDAMYRYSLSGFAEEQAFYKACQDLGAPENYSELLENIHNSKNPAADVDLPVDIKKYVKKNIFLKLLLCAGFFLVDLIAYLCFGKYFIDNWGIVNAVAIFFAIAFFGSASTGIFKYIFDSSWCGEVVKIDVDTVKNTIVNGTRFGAYEENVIRLYVKKPNGKIIICNAMRLAIGGNTPYKRACAIDQYINVGKIEDQVKDYSVGDRVYHFYGLEHLFVYHFEDMSRVSCVVCGMKNPKENKTCGECGHTLIIDEIIE